MSRIYHKHHLFTDPDDTWILPGEFEFLGEADELDLLAPDIDKSTEPIGDVGLKPKDDVKCGFNSKD